MKEMQPAVSKNKRFESQGKSKNFAFADQLGPYCFRCKKRFQNFKNPILLQKC